MSLGNQKKPHLCQYLMHRILKCILSRRPTNRKSSAFYALTTAGIHFLLHFGAAITKGVDLKVQQGYGLAVSELLMAYACGNGVVRLFMQRKSFLHRNIAQASTTWVP